jgi:hypothetical protein
LSGWIRQKRDEGEEEEDDDDDADGEDEQQSGANVTICGLFQRSSTTECTRQPTPQKKTLLEIC